MKELSLQFANYFSKKDVASIGNLLHEDFSLYDPTLKWVKGKKAVLQILSKQFEETKHIRYEVINSYQDGLTSILEFKIELDDKVLYGVDFIVWEKSLMKELRCYYNPPHNETLKPFSEKAKSLQIGSLYQHYKGNQYKVLSISHHSETLEECVIYQALYGDYEIWVRPLAMFLENIVIDGQLQPRFQKIE